MGQHKQQADGKGSQGNLQRLIANNRDLFNVRIRSALNLPTSHRIEWVSPISPDYAEFSDDDFLRVLGLDPVSLKLREFWPKGGPHWDALAKGDSNTVFLVEAKAHIGEIVSPPTGAGDNSLTLIKSQLEATKVLLNATPRVDWTQHFFQYANRLAHLRYLRIDCKIPAFLVFLYFIGDEDVGGPQTKEEWLGAIDLLHAFLGIKRTKLSPHIADVFVEVDAIASNPALHSDGNSAALHSRR